MLNSFVNEYRVFFKYIEEGMLTAGRRYMIYVQSEQKNYIKVVQCQIKNECEI